jgi:hypothetical protein
MWRFLRKKRHKAGQASTVLGFYGPVLKLDYFIHERRGTVVENSNKDRLVRGHRIPI